jgi:hypothetical protein
MEPSLGKELFNSRYGITPDEKLCQLTINANVTQI